MKRALLVAFHYPPAVGSSGIQRTLSFSRYLPNADWQPIVLTASRAAYARVSDDQLGDIPAGVPVIRAFGLDSSRHLAIGGRYWSALALPDRWVSWWASAVVRGVLAVRKYRPEVIWSTFPIATAHLIGMTISRLTGVPWVADFRDSMTEDDYPTDPRKWRLYRSIEQRAMARASRCVFTAPGTQRMYAARYPEMPDEHWQCILNGYDEEVFEDAAASAADAPPANGKTVLLHSGLLYPMERDPSAFFAAISELQQRDDVDVSRLEVRLRASGFEAEYRSQIRELKIDGIVKLLPAVGYAEAIAEMTRVDGLLIFQASNCNHQIPAKLYEYFRAKRPVLALTDPAGDTAAMLRQNGMGTIARLDSKTEIATAIETFVTMLEEQTYPLASERAIASYSRRSQALELARLFDSIARSA